ncbi:ribosome rescue GTPase HflX [Thiomicrorhabdus heinhorstiae]|uniref:GTPase HflX n=1 Tax=Thiomicrorhabdus heinhorstiae TaxID=2748010 RepID=A0ABS0BVB0_9GAMM|nr:ribosome rescue GTPase HflX [Thiomicrorhabdus heinhorstiae]MBF6056993.1 GTPase HflX [Thiomicrorhabdus heinhorstiae]
MELFDRLERRELERAVLVHVDFHNEADREELDEFYELVDSAGAEICTLITTKRNTPDSKYFIGKGKAEEIQQAVELYEADVVIVNHALSPAQERNLSSYLDCQVLDRVGLILDIFAQRARSHEGKLQVELAQLKRMSTRLVKGWSHLDRQGGIGARGPGETQLETDRRLIQGRIKQLESRIEKVRKQRALGRRSRKKSELPTITIVGYTNAGKSTLFNQMTTAGVYAEDRLFATLDSTLRRVHLPGAGPVIFADTVGFIRHIPHDLVTAFRSTLEETSEASLLIHLVDASDPHREEKMRDVFEVIDEVGASEVPQLLVFNKIDAMSPPVEPKVDFDDQGIPKRVWISAKDELGIDALMDAVASFFKGRFHRVELCLDVAAGKRRAELYQLGTIHKESFDDRGNSLFEMTLTEQEWGLVSQWPEILESREI